MPIFDATKTKPWAARARKNALFHFFDHRSAAGPARLAIVLGALDSVHRSMYFLGCHRCFLSLSRAGPPAQHPDHRHRSLFPHHQVGFAMTSCPVVHRVFHGSRPTGPSTCYPVRAPLRVPSPAAAPVSVGRQGHVWFAASPFTACSLAPVVPRRRSAFRSAAHTDRATRPAPDRPGLPVHTALRQPSRPRQEGHRFRNPTILASRWRQTGAAISPTLATPLSAGPSRIPQ